MDPKPTSPPAPSSPPTRKRLSKLTKEDLRIGEANAHRLIAAALRGDEALRIESERIYREQNPET